MLTEPDKRAAALAVSKYGIEKARVSEAVRLVSQAQAEGRQTDLLDTLVSQNLLSPADAEELRMALAKTLLDPRRGSRPPAALHFLSPQPELAGLPQAPARIGSYVIENVLGEGGMGCVYLGHREAGGDPVAIKILPDKLAASKSYVERFYREAKSAAHLDHPNIVRGLDLGRDAATGQYYFAMEYVDGPSAQGLLESSGKLSVGDALRITLDIAHALEHAHARNVIHRDIKPDNILLTSAGVAKLSDLGLAKRTDEDSNLTGSRHGFGTPFYMPYEQSISARQADGRSDIFALGATLYHLLTGEVPFPGGNPITIAEKKCLGTYLPASTRNPEVPAVLDWVLEKMLARDPRDRYQTASELVVALERLNLAAEVPSFATADGSTPELALRKRLSAQVPATEYDASRGDACETTAPATWCLRYRTAGGEWCTARASTDQIVERLQAKLLPADAEVGTEGGGGFVPIAQHPAFGAQQLAGAVTIADPARRRPWLYWLLPLVLVVVGGLIALILLAGC
jgi:serine/threonine-protein kinase